MFQSTLCSPVIFYFAVPLINDTSFIFNHFFSGKAHEYFLSIFKSDTVLCLYLWTLSWLGVIVSTAVFFPSTFVSSAPSSVIGCGEAWSQLIFFSPYRWFAFSSRISEGFLRLASFLDLNQTMSQSWKLHFEFPTYWVLFQFADFFLNFREVYFMSSKHLLVHLLVFLLQWHQLY